MRWLLLVLVACSHAPSLDRDAIINAADRDPGDRAKDPQRRPAELLAFAGIAPGMHVADLGSGTGYTSELLARAVGANGSVIAQDTPHWGGPWMERPWAARLAKPVMAHTTHVMLGWNEPLPADAHDLDVVTFVAAYHDVKAEKDDTAKLNSAVFAALKHGGTYIVIDNSAKPGTGTDACEPLHRIDEQVVRDEVTHAGFRLAATSDFMRQPKDTRDWNADPSAKDPRVHTQDLFALKFVKP
ncbi:MAG TPA: SAM-dependent methyltransferase [Kofleriaceae bacterium]|nr:SAM-dependent methyltransferase [Kofleriaceae bacterium]